MSNTFAQQAAGLLRSGYGNDNTARAQAMAVAGVAEGISDVAKAISEVAKRLPEEPMHKIVTAPAPVQDVVDRPLSERSMTFHCQSHNADTLTVREIANGQYEVYAFMEVDDAETLIHLSASDAKRLARAILGST